MKIFLIGLPASGKSSLGKELAGMLHVSFVDLDVEIEKECGRKVSEIFKQHGEDYFRQRESWQLQKWCDSDSHFVMATGGGTPCFHDNMSRMKMAGATVFVNAPIQEIGHRLKRSNLSERPLFAGLGEGQLQHRLEELQTRRQSFYDLAQYTIRQRGDLNDLMEKLKADQQ